jgi:hypothetical protein
MRFIHTAELQIGLGLSPFAEKAGAWRTARMTALGGILDIANKEKK